MERAGTEDSIAEAEQEEEVIINEIMLTSGMRFRELFVVMLRFLSPPLFHQLSFLAHDATLLIP